MARLTGGLWSAVHGKKRGKPWSQRAHTRGGGWQLPPAKGGGRTLKITFCAVSRICVPRVHGKKHPNVPKGLKKTIFMPTILTPQKSLEVVCP